MDATVHILLMYPPYSGDPEIFTRFQYSWVLDHPLLKQFVRQIQWVVGFVPCLAPSGLSKKPRAQKVGLVTLAAADQGKVPLRETCLTSVGGSSQLPGHLLVFDAPDDKSGQMNADIKAYLGSHPEIKATLFEDTIRRSWGYTKLRPRWVTEVWCKEEDPVKFSECAFALARAVGVGSGIFMGILSMERMRGGELLLDCRGVDAAHNEDLYNECDFMLPVSSSKIVLLTRSTADVWTGVLTAHNKAAWANNLPRVYSLTSASGEVWAAPETAEDDAWTTVSSVISRTSDDKGWPNTRVLAVSSSRLPNLPEDQVKSWLTPVFEATLGPAASEVDGKEVLAWSLSRRLNKNRKWGRSSIFLDFVDPDAAKAAVYNHTMGIYQPDPLVGGIQWTLSSNHWPVLEEARVLESFGRLAIEDATKRMENAGP